ncbi:MAG: hypothetical protein LBO09_05650 [Candidatus Peribacteria bacterium]|jgi:hypothetical protein|nr:hypothetical protein [Candidatus Peribacteria bacterium]
MKNHPHLQSVLDTVIQRDEGIAQAIQKSEQEQGIYNVDVFSQKQINGLFLFDNEGHGGGKDFFFSNVKKFKDKGFSIENNIDDVMVNKVILKK